MPIPFICPHCGAKTIVPDEYAGRTGPCASCRNPVTIPLPSGPTPPDLGEDPLVRALIPVGRSLWAIAAGYAGLFAVLCFPAPIALILGIVAIWDIKKHPKRHGMGRAVFGLVMGALFTGLIVVFLIAAALK